MKLKDIQCRNAKPQEKAYKLFDGGGMYLEVSPSGSRYWRLKYRILNKEKRLALGVYPEVSLQEARQKRDEARKLIREGIDPVEHKRQAKDAAIENAENTFKSVALEWHGQNVTRWSKNYARNETRHVASPRPRFAGGCGSNASNTSHCASLIPSKRPAISHPPA